MRNVSFVSTASAKQAPEPAYESSRFPGESARAHAASIQTTAMLSSSTIRW